MSLDTFNYRINEARPAIMDSEGFWKFHAWVDQQKIWLLNDDIGSGKAQLIPSGLDNPIITFGKGFHWQVEHVERCSVCGVQITFIETSTISTCFADTSAATDDYLANH